MRGGCIMLIAGALLAGCLAAPADGTPSGGDGAVAQPDGTPGPDAPLPVCGDGTALAIAHVATIVVPDTRSSIPLAALAVFDNRGETTIDTRQIEITGVTTIGSADLAIGIANGGQKLLPGEAHGYLDADSRPLMQELISGFWSDQARPEVLGSIVHPITGGTFQGTIDYRLGEYTASVLVTFSVEGPTDAIGGGIFELACP